MRLFNKIVRKLSGLNKPLSVGSSNEAVRVAWLKKTLGAIPNGYRILDAGAGEQQFRKFCTHLQYVSQDFAQYNPEAMDYGIQMQQWNYGQLDIVSDIAKIPEPDASFDAIMCTEVFEHIVNPREAIVEFSRLLRSGGTLIITAPFCSLTHFAPYHFYTGFNRFFYETELDNNGFELVEIVPNGNYFEYMGQELNRLDEVMRTFSKRKLSSKAQLAKDILLQELAKASEADQGSDSLLNFGLHVRAIKK